MRLYSWNVNGFRALCSGGAWSWFARTAPDIVGLQEVKAEFPDVPEAFRTAPGYRTFWLPATGRRGYSGVAAFSRITPLAEQYDLPDPAFRGEGRLIHLELPSFHFLNVYFPNGQKDEARLNYKLGYYDAFLNMAEDLRRTKPVVVCGDFNTAHNPVDLARPADNEHTSGFLPVERAWLDRFTAAGYTDTFRLIHGDEPDRYSWWSYRTRARERNVGWRIDYFFVSEEMKDRVKNAWIEDTVTGSDHCPVGLELDCPSD